MRNKFLSVLLITILVCLNLSTIISNAAIFNIDFNTTTESISLVNLDTNTVVYEKNPDQKRSPASVTKIMTYIITAENVADLEGTKITVTNEILEKLYGTGSSLSGLQMGDNLSVYQILHCLMIPSGNDAALVLADYVGNGDVSKFVDLMNEKAKQLGCENTHFMNPHGLYDANHYTTSNDMAKIAKYAMTLPHFTEITSEVVSNVLGDNRLLVTTNSLTDAVRGGSYYYKYAKGIKTGHIDESGYCLVSTAVKSGYTYMCVALGAPSVDAAGKTITTNGAMIDSKELYMWAFDSLQIKSIIDTTTSIGEVNVKYAWNKDSTMLVPANSLTTVLPSSVQSSSIEIVTDVPDSVNAPIKMGQKIGTATLRYANQDLATVDLVASEEISRNYIVFFIDLITTIATSKWFIIAVVILLILLVVYLMLSIAYNKKNAKSKRGTSVQRSRNKRGTNKYRRR